MRKLIPGKIARETSASRTDVQERIELEQSIGKRQALWDLLGEQPRMGAAPAILLIGVPFETVPSETSQSVSENQSFHSLAV